MSENWTTRKILAWTSEHFAKRSIDSPRLTAEVLLAHVLKVDRVRLYVDLDRPLEPEERAAYRALIERRMTGEPTQYLTGAKEFYNRRFKVDPRVLIPRPETELLVEAVLRVLPRDAPSRVLDLCTGSGCIGISIAAERPQASVWATDASSEACDVARLNAEALQVDARVTVRQGDLFAPLPKGALFDVVSANPPYVKTGELDALPLEVKREPHVALDGGADGLDLTRRIARQAGEWLKPGGLLALEISDTQGEPVRALLADTGYADVRIEKDLAHLDRFAFGRRPT
jgi:release factor glutamine methyltransferase